MGVLTDVFFCLSVCFFVEHDSSFLCVSIVEVCMNCLVLLADVFEYFCLNVMMCMLALVVFFGADSVVFWMPLVGVYLDV